MNNKQLKNEQRLVERKDRFMMKCKRILTQIYLLFNSVEIYSEDRIKEFSKMNNEELEDFNLSKLFSSRKKL